MRIGITAGLLALLPTLVGCGEANTALVSGTVTVDGKPIRQGAITFTPVDGEGWTAGSPIKDGAYSARVPATVLKVVISMPKVVGTKKIYDTPDSPEMPITKEALPERFNTKTELQIEPTAGTMHQDFELTGSLREE
jgi:hypothetical protein